MWVEIPAMLAHRPLTSKSFSQSWSSGKWRRSDQETRKAQYICECESVQTIHTRRKCTQVNCKHCDFESICLMRDISEISFSTPTLDSKTISPLDWHQTFSRSACAFGAEIARIFTGANQEKSELWNFTKETNSQSVHASTDDASIDMLRLSEWCDGDTNLINTVLKMFCEQGRRHYIDLTQAFAVMDWQGLTFHSVSSHLISYQSTLTCH